MSGMTDKDLKTCVEMIATLTGMGLEKTIRWLELYYKVRRSWELGGSEEERDPEPGEEKELSPQEKATILKRETRERMMKILAEKKGGTKSLAEAAGVEEGKILRIMESKPEKVDVYRKIAEAIEQMERTT